MSPDEAALIRLWKEKRGEAEPEDLSDNLVVQLGVATEALNRTWYERNTGRAITDVQRWVQHPVHRFLAATLDGFVNDLDAVFEAKFMLPWSFSEEAAAEKHMAQLQHNMWVTNARSAALSIITGGGKWIEMTIPADALYQHFLITAERRFWRCVQTGETPRPYGVEPPRPRIEAVRIVDMSGSNSWAELAGLYCATRSAFLDHERAKAELKALMPEDAKEATGHGVRAKRSKSGAVSFDLLDQGTAMQRSSETIGAIAVGAGEGAGRAHQSGEGADRYHSRLQPTRSGSDLPLCAALERPRHRTEDFRRPRDRDRSDDGDRQGGGADPTHHHACPFVGRVAVVGMAGVCDHRNGGAASHGSRAHLRKTLRSVHVGWHRGRGRSRRAGSQCENRGRPKGRARFIRWGLGAIGRAKRRDKRKAVGQLGFWAKGEADPSGARYAKRRPIGDAARAVACRCRPNPIVG